MATPQKIVVLDAAGRKVIVDAAHPIAAALVPGGIGSGDWEIAVIRDSTANENDKTVTVPASYEYQVLSIWIEYTSDGNAGNRQIAVGFRDSGGNLIGEARPNIVQAASLTRYYWMAPALENQAAFYDTDLLHVSLPPTVFLTAGCTIRVWDNGAISAADDFVLVINVAQRFVG